ncbi:MAG: hypothetical protein AzoDbin1_05456, partial [Azoarcus sp.]|nr:hypothetical protein [Azoarcus sp.]
MVDITCCYRVDCLKITVDCSTFFLNLKHNALYGVFNDFVQVEGFPVEFKFFFIEPKASTPSSGDERELVDALSVAPNELHRLAFRDAPHRLDVLSRLPEVISSATDDADLFARLCDMLLAGI